MKHNFKQTQLNLVQMKNKFCKGIGNIMLIDTVFLGDAMFNFANVIIMVYNHTEVKTEY